MALRQKNGVLVLADGTVFRGCGVGKKGVALGELCFQTAMSGYQEILSDPSYHGQIVTFTFPHIGNVGVNHHDDESHRAYAVGMVTACPLSLPSNYRSSGSLQDWLCRHAVVGV